MLEVLEIFLEVIKVSVAAAAVSLAVGLELVFLKQLQLGESHLNKLKINKKQIFKTIERLSLYKYHRC